MKRRINKYTGVLAVVLVGLLLTDCRNGPDNGEKGKQGIVTPASPPPYELIGEKTANILIENVSIPPPKPNETGPFVSRRVDLEKGKTGTADFHDMEIMINARQNTLGVSFVNGTELGKTKVQIHDLALALENGPFVNQVQCFEFPSGYFGLKTRSGHLNQFRIRAIHKDLIDAAQRRYNIRVEIENAAWKQIKK